jgi:UPF0716 family protein affecting phage T7 exclusion
MSWPGRWVLGLAALLLVAPGLKTGLIGLALASPVMLVQAIAARRDRAVVPAGGE